MSKYRDAYIAMREANHFDMQFFWDYYNENECYGLTKPQFETYFKHYLRQNRDEILILLDLEFQVTITTAKNGKVCHVS